ncbi:LPS assembly lipoprotein LptE [Rhodohalobacter sp. 614A]|uniref:LPS assembly lipoprotein LptE n=1 Tax=Rhodohalobacter sp. 614A TaxID=2908649 RepID=UPI001F22E40D|nr:LPS assembly lipoprotein LptE [Rhodohalobacter sp. 614A]
MDCNRRTRTFLIALLILFSGCISYSFTGTSIPSDVQNIYIPFFPDQSQSGLGNLSDRLNRALLERFVNQSRLSLANDQETSDAFVEGAIQSYVNRPFSIGGDQQANLNEVSISVRATFQFASDEEPLWTSTFTGSATYDVLENPVDGELEAAETALQQIANNMFNDAVSNW